MRTSFLAAVLLGVAATAASADRFSVVVAGDNLGTIDYSDAAGGGRAELTSILDSTPFGVFDGSFAATSVTAGSVIEHASRTRSTRKSRDVALRIAGGRAETASVTPESEQTDLSQPAQVPAGVVDPVTGFGHLLRTGACPGPVRIYDGRRVTELTATGSSRDGAIVTCNMDYRVVAGPGYLSPLGLTSFRLVLNYDTSATGPWVLTRLDARTGIFGLSLLR